MTRWTSGRASDGDGYSNLRAGEAGVSCRGIGPDNRRSIVDMLAIGSAVTLVVYGFYIARSYFAKLVGARYIPYGEVVPGWYVAVPKHGKPLPSNHSERTMVEVRQSCGGLSHSSRLWAFEPGTSTPTKLTNYVYLKRIRPVSELLDSNSPPRYNLDIDIVRG